MTETHWLLIHLAISWYMIGLVWFVQINHYPSYLKVPESAWIEFQQFHLKSTFPLTFPQISLQALSFVAIFIVSEKISTKELVYPAIALGVIWLTTYGYHVPTHLKMRKAYKKQWILGQIRVNWIRCILWTLHGAWFTWLLYHHFLS